MSLESEGSRIVSRVHEEADNMAHVAEVFRGDGRWKRDKRFVHMTGKPETVSEYLASLVVAMM